MKKILTALVLALLLAAAACCALAVEIENAVTTTETGYANVLMSNGYYGHCIDHNRNMPRVGAVYIPHDTTYAANNKDGSSIGNYLKILFTKYWDELSGDNKTSVRQNIIWQFSDVYYPASTNNYVQGVLDYAADGLVIPDHGHVEKVGDRWCRFDFGTLESMNTDYNDFFAYKTTEVKPITVSEDERGTVTADTQYAAPGETVTLTVETKDGFTLENLTLDAGSALVALNRIDENTYSFNMPNAAVKVLAFFSGTPAGDDETGDDTTGDATGDATAEDKAAASDLPKTGDESMPMLWMALCAMSGAAIVLLRRKVKA